VKNFVDTAYLKAKDVINTHRDALARIAEALLVREVLDASEVNLLIEGKPLPEVARHAPAKPSPPETTQVLKPHPAPGLSSRERPQPA
jgi:cell division protease FtsH